jgi:hypothetical protein
MFARSFSWGAGRRPAPLEEGSVCALSYGKACANTVFIVIVDRYKKTSVKCAKKNSSDLHPVCSFMHNNERVVLP